MPSTPSSPITPSRKRRSLRLPGFDASNDPTSTPYMSGTTNGTIHSQASGWSSYASVQQSSPTSRPMSSRSSRRQSFQNRRKSSSRLSIGSNISLGQFDGGIGNLADELEDALEDDYDGNGTSFLDGLREGSIEPSNDIQQDLEEIDDIDRFGMAVPSDTPSKANTLSVHTPEMTQPSKADRRKPRHRRTESRYDGSDYGPDSDQDDDGFPPMLAKRIRDLESLTRTSINTEDTLSEGGGVVKRTTHALRDLGPQTNVENGLTRIITAYTSMAMHRTHKTRDLFSQAHSFLYGNTLGLSEETIDSLLQDIQLLSSTVPVSPQPNPLLSLQILASQTIDLAHALRSLTDVLQESRISSSTATRKLKSVKDMVDETQMEQELIETSMMLIHAGDWDRRCRERQAAATCREVVQGFGTRWGLEVEDRPWIHEQTQVAT